VDHYSISFSTDETKFAYIPASISPSHIVIRDLVTFFDTWIAIPEYVDNWTGGLLWSSDNSRIVYAVLDFVASEELQYESFNVILVDVMNRTSRIVLENHNGRLCPQEWVDENHILTADWCWEDYGRVEQILNLETGDLTPLEN
jgi:hypothetical protein